MKRLEEESGGKEGGKAGREEVLIYSQTWSVRDDDGRQLRRHVTEQNREKLAIVAKMG